MRIKEIDPSFELENLIDLEKVSPSLLHSLISAFRRSTPNVEIDRNVLITTMYGVDGADGIADDGTLNSLSAEMSALMSSSVGADWSLDDLVTDPLEKEGQELENKLLRSKISTELARAAKVRTEVQRIEAQADQAQAAAETARSFLPPWKQS